MVPLGVALDVTKGGTLVVRLSVELSEMVALGVPDADTEDVIAAV
jgi:hypothetical protein